MKVARWAFAIGLMGCLASTASAQMYAPGSDQAVPGEKLFEVCSFCHAPQGQGSQRLDAPAIAGLDSWYIERQLHNFRSRLRGMHPEDVPGLQMSIISGVVRNEATIKNIAAYIASLKPGAPPETFNGRPLKTTRPFIWRSPYAQFESPSPGDPARGAELYKATCSACHGAAAEGNEALGAPRLTHMLDWYEARELKYFRDGIRGASPGDVYGAQMAAVSKVLTDDQSIADIIAYIDTL